MESKIEEGSSHGHSLFIHATMDLNRLSDISVELAEGLAQNTLSKVDEAGVIAVELGVPAADNHVSKTTAM